MKEVFTGLLIVLILFSYVIAQQSIDVLVEGISDGARNSQQQDRDEAILDAKLKAIERAGVSIEAVTVMENFKLKSDWVKAKADGVILPGFQILDQGYGADGLYHVVLSGKVSKDGEAAGDSEGDRKFRMAKLLLETDKNRALGLLREVVDNYQDCSSADDALYNLIINADSKLQEDEYLIKLKAYYPKSSYIARAEIWINEASWSNITAPIHWIRIPGGSFMMGSPSTEEGRDSDEGPRHRVTVQPFYMMTTEVTQAQWIAVMGNNPSHFKGDNLPVENVSWNDCQEFFKKLNQNDQGKGYRLPTEAEWEYACRAGTTTRFHNGDNISDFNRVAWHLGNSESKTNPVSGRQPNDMGLYDMHGNAWEWCEDRYHPSYHDAPTNGSVWLSGGSGSRVLRGGSWNHSSSQARCANRSYGDPSNQYSYIGFRCARNP